MQTLLDQSEVVTDMSKSRAMGSTAYQASDQAFFCVGTNYGRCA